ncbi:hypothetical protein JCM11251_003217 [Rhodosporidiobolus azoricus]
MATPLPPRLLTNLTDPSSPYSHAEEHDGGSGSDEGGSTPATPSKDKMREWTFPRTSGSGSASSASSSSTRHTAHAAIDLSSSSAFHGRSSSIAPSAQSPPHASSSETARRPLLQHASSSSSAASRDFRHRTNASLAFAASATPEIGSSPRGGFSQLPSLSSSSLAYQPASLTKDPSSSSSPGPDASSALKLLYSNLRRRSLNDLVYLVIFGSAFVLFSSALLGVGYNGAGPTSSSYPASSPRAVGSYSPPSSPGVGVVDVKIPPTFLRPEDLRDEHGHVEVPADVHQPFGSVEGGHDDDGGREEEEHFRETPEEWEGVVGDEAVHAHPDPAARPPTDPALFPDPEAADHSHASEDSLLAEHDERERRPRPARLERVREVEEAGEDEALVEEEGDEDVDLSPDAVDSSTLPESDTADPDDDEDDDDDEDPLVDDSIDILHPATHADGSLHLVDDEQGEEDELSALEELLDAGLEEEEEEQEEGEKVQVQRQRMEGAGGAADIKKRMVKRFR